MVSKVNNKLGGYRDEKVSILRDFLEYIKLINLCNGGAVENRKIRNNGMDCIFLLNKPLKEPLLLILCAVKTTN